MKRALEWGLLFLCLTPMARAGSLTLEEFKARMQQHLNALSGKATAGIQMELLGAGGKVIFSHNQDKPLVPASNAKLITTAAALENLGPGFTFETKVYLDGNDLVIAGNGDPYLVSERLWLLARDVARTGVKKVDSIKVNDSAFTEDYRGLTEFQDSGEPFTAIVAATSLNFNSLELHVSPDPAQTRPRLDVGTGENPFVTVKNEVSQKGGKSVTVKSLGTEGLKENFVATGSLAQDALPLVVYTTVSQPEVQVAAAFAALLRKEGVAVGSDFGGLSRAPVSAKAKLVASLESLPLQDLVRLLNNYSNNFMAEEVFQALGAGVLGAPASLQKSRQVVADFLQRHEACRGSRLENGSGLAWGSQMSARCFVDTLQSAYRDFLAFADLLGSLPEGGQTGTLKNRFKLAGADFEAKKVRAKTGTLWSQKAVSSLTGITSTASGEKVVFSLIENDSRADRGLLRGLKDWEDKCVELVQELRL